MATRDYYEVLGVGKGATAEELKKAYRRKALEWHPDRNKDPKAAEMFKEVTKAYEVLSDPQKKAAFDQYGAAAFDSSSRMGGQPPGGGGFGRQGPFNYSYYTTSGGQSPFGGGFEGSFTDPFEIFEQFFGSASPFGRSNRVPHYQINIDFMDAARGTEKEVEIGGKRRRIKIPAGVDDGQRIRFTDFVLEVSIKSDKKFRREGADVYVELPVHFAVATLGGTVNAPTIDGEVKIKIRPATQPGTTIRLNGRGLPVVNGRGKGDEYVIIKIAIPEHLNDREKRALEELLPDK